MEDKLPEYINTLVDNCLEVGNAYGKTTLCEKLAAAIEEHAAATDTLFLLGADTRYKACEQGDKAIKVLEKVEKLVLDLAGDLPTVVTLTGRLPEGILMKDVKSMLSRFHERGIRTVIDSRSFTLADLIEVKPYLIKPNEEEIVTYMHREVNSISDALAAARELHECGITNVMISMGAKGAVLVSEEGEFTASAPAITPVSTIGAGDSSIAGYLAALSRGERAKTCLCYAIAFGSAACLTEGTKSPNVSDVERFLQK